MLGYFEPSCFGNSAAKGARELPQNAKDEFARIKKNNKKIKTSVIAT